MSFRFVVVWAMSAVSALSCQRQPGPGETEPRRETESPRENATVQSRVTPECYRFDVRMSEARIAAGPAADDSKFRRRFDFETDAAPWTIAEGSARCVIAEGALVIETETQTRCDSPRMTGIPASTVASILIRARVFGCSQFALAWRGENGEFLKDNEAPIDVPESEGWTLYQIDMTAIGGWRSQLGNVGQLRLILPAKAKMEVRSIGLAGNLDPFAGRSYGQMDYPYKRDYVHTIFTRTPCSLEYDVTVMANARLRFGFSRHPRVPAQFRVLLKDGPDQVVLAEEQGVNANVQQKVAVDLSRWAGKEVQIRFEAESEQPGTVALWCNPTLARVYPLTEARRPINVIWYVIDCLRATSVGAYGYERETTPTIDAVAREGARFEWCFSPGTWTIDSVASFFTGLSPNAHGMSRTRARIPESMHVLAEILRNGGYSTALFSDNPYLSERKGFVRGFDEARRFRVRDPRARGGATGDKYPINAAIGAFFAEHREDAVFLYVHTIEPHHPYVPPASLRRFVHPDGSAKETDLYDDCIAWADANLGYIIGRLKEEGLWNNTLLIISADHGNSFPEFDSGLEGHGEAPYLSRVRIPLVMRLPGVVPEGVVIQENVGALDIPPTLFDLLHIEPDPQFGGWSLLGLLDGSRKAEFAQRSIYPSGQRPKWQAAVRDRWFFLDNDGEGELLDLQTDPPQNANVIQAHPDVARELLEETRNFRKSELARAEEFPIETDVTISVDQRETEQLKALGYIH